jgi:hypothetical protein
VANANTSPVAVFDVQKRGESRSLGSCRLMVSDQCAGNGGWEKLLVANGKGLILARPQWTATAKLHSAEPHRVYRRPL